MVHVEIAIKDQCENDYFSHGLFQLYQNTTYRSEFVKWKFAISALRGQLQLTSIFSKMTKEEKVFELEKRLGIENRNCS